MAQMTGPPLSYDDFIAREPAPGLPAPADVQTMLGTLRAQRRALQQCCDEAKDARAAEPDLELGNQMEEATQTLGGTLSHLEKAIPQLERAQAGLAQYAAVIDRIKGIVAELRARRAAGP